MRTGLLPFAVLGAAVISQLQTNPAISQDCNENGIDDAQDILGSSGTFPSAPRYTVSAPPGGISSADFNQDGTVDLAASSNGPQGIWLLNNEGKGTFQKYKLLPTNKDPVSLVAADINGDGIPDLITADAFSGNANENATLSLFFNNGDETFRVGSKIVTGDPRVVLALDINNDSQMDLVAASRFAATITVLTHNDKGGFTKTDEHTFPEILGSLTGADFDGDDAIDLAVTTLGTSFDVLGGTGTGTFTPRSIVKGDVGSNEFLSIASADVDRDGDVDVMAAYTGDLLYALRTPGGVVVFLNDGHGVFLQTDIYDVAPLTGMIVPADLNNDGAVDVVTANSNWGLMSSNISVLTNNGHGGFTPAVHYATGADTWAISVADLDGDAWPDIAAANGGSRDISILMNEKNGTFRAPHAILCNLHAFAATADVDGDGYTDILSAELNTASNILVYENNKDGTFSNPLAYHVQTTPTFIYPFDLDGDGNVDIAVIDFTGGISVLLNQKDGTFSTPLVFYAGNDPRKLAAADVDADGFMDLVVANFGSRDVSTLLNTGNGTLSNAMNFDVGASPIAIVVTDLTGDGTPDIATANPEAKSIALLRNAGDGNFREPVSQVLDGSPTSIIAGDLNVDGSIDLVAANQLQRSLSILMKDGKESWAAPQTYKLKGKPAFLAGADLDGDGDLDIAVHTDAFEVTVLENKGNGKLEMRGSYASGAIPISVAAADLDGDGRVDLVTNGITIFLNEVAAAFSKDGNKNGIPDECEIVLFHRGDPNDDGQINLTDAVHILHFLFLGGEPTPCMESANVNDDEAINLTDAISLLQYLFLSGAPPAAPGPLEAPCGPDPANSPVNLGCQSYAHCQ